MTAHVQNVRSGAVGRFSTIRRQIPLAVIHAWWDSFLGIFGQLSDDNDADFQRDERSRRFDNLDADARGGGAGGNFDGAGTGGQD
jgi:hypothetical protein